MAYDCFRVALDGVVELAAGEQAIALLLELRVAQVGRLQVLGAHRGRMVGRGCPSSDPDEVHWTLKWQLDWETIIILGMTIPCTEKLDLMYYWSLNAHK